MSFCKSARQLSDSQLASLSLVQQECCLFVFLDGSAHYFDDFLKVRTFSRLSPSKHLKILSSKARTGEYRLQPGRVNGRPHYVRFYNPLHSFRHICKIDLKLEFQPWVQRAEPIWFFLQLLVEQQQQVFQSWQMLRSRLC